MNIEIIEFDDDGNEHPKIISAKEFFKNAYVHYESDWGNTSAIIIELDEILMTDAEQDRIADKIKEILTND